MLGRTDPFEFWLQEALVHAGALAFVSPAEILAVIQNAFGKDWLAEKVKESEKGTTLNSSRHPLAQMILVPGKKQVAEMFELGIYLKELHSIPRLDEVIRQLKNKEDFANTVLQLDYGFRFLRVGVTDMSFEPDVDDGRKADILFRFNGQQYLAECFLPEVGDDWYGEFGQLVQKRVFEFASKKNKQICLRTILRNDPPFNVEVRKDFENDCRQMIEVVDVAHPQSIEKANYGIKIWEISGLTADEKEALFRKYFNEKYCRFVYKTSMMPKSDALNTMRGAGSEREAHGMLFFLIEEEEVSQEHMVNSLAKKIERKVTQLRMKGTDTRGILVVSSPTVHPRNMKSTKPFDRLQGKVVDAHKHIDAAIIVHKTTGPAGDPRFGGYALQARREGAKTEILDALEALEAKGPLLP